MTAASGVLLESWKLALVCLVVILLSILSGVLCIMINVRFSTVNRSACLNWALPGWSFLLFIASCVSARVHLYRSDEMFPWYILLLGVLELLTVSTQIFFYKIQQRGTNNICRRLMRKLWRNYGDENQS
ncbi:uncharacterized protein LOC128240410 [Mya arenaria]|uniref:uncharacterized protein LOC128240410 n=1 Tax=Mya arenaria TaxID=6604 RepID=UPI0022E58D6B|nr:uncharacterized protein LOC128240410 [Mya arenaria]